MCSVGMQCEQTLVIFPLRIYIMPFESIFSQVTHTESQMPVTSPQYNSPCLHSVTESVSYCYLLDCLLYSLMFSDSSLCFNIWSTSWWWYCLQFFIYPIQNIIETYWLAFSEPREYPNRQGSIWLILGIVVAWKQVQVHAHDSNCWAWLICGCGQYHWIICCP